LVIVEVMTTVTIVAVVAVMVMVRVTPPRLEYEEMGAVRVFEAVELATARVKMTAMVEAVWRCDVYQKLKRKWGRKWAQFSSEIQIYLIGPKNYAIVFVTFVNDDK
jgi:hypothetical protein